MFQRFRNSVNKVVWKYYLWESFMTNNQVLIFAQVQQGAGNIPQTFWSMLTCQILTLVADFSSACPQWESFPPHPICALFDIWGLWRTFEYRELILSCDQDSRLRWFDVCIMLCYPARKTATLLWETLVFEWAPVCSLIQGRMDPCLHVVWQHILNLRTNALLHTLLVRWRSECECALGCRIKCVSETCRIKSFVCSGRKITK